jgi:hypothetical protein
MSPRTLRIINVILGVWLFASTSLWPHSPPQASNNWIVGGLIVAFALASVRFPNARFFNAAAAIWLFLSCFALPMATAATFWNNLLVAFGVFFVSAIRAGERTIPGPTARAR